ncbi:MAG: hypothetical protein ACK4WH_02280 [Phycisphaerales bacterium]
MSTAGGVWYTLVGNGNTLTVNTCANGTFDTKLYVYCSTNSDPCATPTNFFCVGGNDDGGTAGCPGATLRSTVTFCSAAGQTYYVLVTPFSTSTVLGSGDFDLTVIDSGTACTTAGSCTPTTAGACCNNTTQVCTIVTSPAGCSTGTYQGAGTACTYFSPCTGVGACCSGTGTCTVVLPANCTGTSTHLGVGTACLPTNPCTALLGTCCNNTSGACSTTTALGCPVATSTFGGVGTVCGIDLCPNTGACCSGTGTCTVTVASSCAGATQTFLGVGTPCLPTNPCTALLGTCCNNTTGACSTTTMNGCSITTSTFGGAGTVCGVDLCPNTGACCSVSGTCTLVLAANCTGSSTFQGVGVACLPNPCPQPVACCLNECCALVLPAQCTAIGGTDSGSTCSPNPCTVGAPANDLCIDAQTIVVGTAIVGSNCGATLETGEPAPTCQANYSKSVWYKVTPATTGFYTVSTCGASFDCILSVFTTPDCITFTSVACDDDACAGGEAGPVGTGSGLASVIGAVALDGGQEYLIRVSSFSTTQGFFPLLVSTNTVAGACCNTVTGACTVSLTGAPGCGAGTTFLGGVCNPNPCPQPTGACCANDGTCAVTTGLACVSPSIFLGNATVCAPGDTCSDPNVGSCCNACGTVCTYVASSAACTGTSVYTAGGVCNPSPCVPAAPANDLCSGATAVTVGANPGTNLCATTDFAVDPSSQCGATTGAGGARDVWHTFTPAQSAAYTFNTCDAIGFDTVLALYGDNTGTNVCPTAGTDPVRACNDDAACSFSGLRSEIANQLLFAGQTYYVRVAAWAGGTAEGPYVLNITQGEAAGACCTGTSCEIVLASACPVADYQGDFTSCSPNPCLPAEGACCCGSTCTLTPPAACTGPNQFFSGSGSSCVPYNTTVPCCRADYNKVAGITVQDIFDFLTAYFAPDACADTNDSTTITVQDIFDFLAAYFAGCP